MHLHKGVQGTPPLKHEQMFLLQVIAQPHLTNSSTSSGAGGSRQWTGDVVLVSGSRIHPHSVTGGRTGFGLLYAFNTRPTRFVLWINGIKVATVGGRFSASLFFLLQSFHRNSGIEWGPSESYAIHMNCAIGLRTSFIEEHSSVERVPNRMKASMMGLSSGKLKNSLHQVCFVIPTYLFPWSSPVNMWNPSSARLFRMPTHRTRSLMSICGNIIRRQRN